MGNELRIRQKFQYFFSVFPLNDAPYTAAYEEQEVYAALSEYLQQAQGVDILPQVRLLIAEFIKYTPSRISAYYPPMLPNKMLNEKPKTGEIDPELWVAIEDLQDGRKASGEVGQEVYGAGVAFGIVPRQYIKLSGTITLFIGYPIVDYQLKKQSCAIRIGGSEQLTCQVVIQLEKSDEYAFIARGKQGEVLDIDQLNTKLMRLNVRGNQSLLLNWKKIRSKDR